MFYNIKKYLHNQKTLCIFASSLQETKKATFISVVFFLATILGNFSNGYCAEKSVIVSCKTEKVAFLIFKNNDYSFMQETTKNQSKSKNSKQTLTPPERNAGITSRQADLLRRVKLQCLKSNAFYESLQKITGQDFIIEKNAKNEAYYYIISSGILDDFITFCYNYVSNDPHRDCITCLTTNLK